MPLDVSGSARSGGALRRWRCVVALWMFVPGCTLEEGGAGEPCLRTAQCTAGLVCVQGECSTDIDSISEETDVPMLTPEAATPAMAADAMPPDGGTAGATGSGGTSAGAGAAEAGP